MIPRAAHRPPRVGDRGAVGVAAQRDLHRVARAARRAPCPAVRSASGRASTSGPARRAQGRSVVRAVRGARRCGAAARLRCAASSRAQAVRRGPRSGTPRSAHSIAAAAGMMYGTTTAFGSPVPAERAAVEILARARPVLTDRARGGRALQRLGLPRLDAEHVGFATQATAQRPEVGVGRGDALAGDEQVQPVTGLWRGAPYRAVRA